MREGRESPGPLQAADQHLSEMRELLTRAAEDSEDRNGLILEASCDDLSGSRQARIYPRGVGVWNRTHQFQLPQKSMNVILGEFLDQDYLALDERYGEPSAAPLVTCWITLSIGGLTKRSAQFSKGPQSETLRRLANTVLDTCEPFGQQGIQATSLEDGLAKISRGELAPEVLSVFFQQVPSPPDAAPGFHLSLHGCRAEARTYDLQHGIGEPHALELDCDGTLALASRLLPLAPWDWPQNFWSDSYTDLSLQVLDHQREFQAKRFAGLTSDRDTPSKRSFEELIEILKSLP